MRGKRTTPSVDFTSHTDQHSSPLFKLPAELREQIYGYVSKDVQLTWRQRSGKTGKKDRGRNVWLDPGKPNPPGMVLACKQMHQESTPILYKHANFLFNTRTAFTHWLRAIGEENLKAVQEVERGHKYIGFWTMTRPTGGRAVERRDHRWIDVENPESSLKIPRHSEKKPTLNWSEAQDEWYLHIRQVKTRYSRRATAMPVTAVQEDGGGWTAGF